MEYFPKFSHIDDLSLTLQKLHEIQELGVHILDVETSPGRLDLPKVAR